MNRSMPREITERDRVVEAVKNLALTAEPLTVDHDWWWPEDSEKLSKAMEELG
jgi:hypothetical protein